MTTIPMTPATIRRLMEAREKPGDAIAERWREVAAFIRLNRALRELERQGRR